MFYPTSVTNLLIILVIFMTPSLSALICTDSCPHLEVGAEHIRDPSLSYDHRRGYILATTSHFSTALG